MLLVSVILNLQSKVVKIVYKKKIVEVYQEGHHIVGQKQINVAYHILDIVITDQLKTNALNARQKLIVVEFKEKLLIVGEDSIQIVILLLYQDIVINNHQIIVVQVVVQKKIVEE
jgi:hypothetical protein